MKDPIIKIMITESHSWIGKPHLTSSTEVNDTLEKIGILLSKCIVKRHLHECDSREAAWLSWLFTFSQILQN